MDTYITRGHIVNKGAPMSSIQPLVYHRVCSDREDFSSTYVVRESDFRRQMEYILAHGYRAVTLDELLSDDGGAVGQTAKRVLVTFDDGYEDNYIHAFPILREYKIPAVIFLVADFSRRTNWWDVPLGIPETRLLTPGQIAEMAGHGIEFGSHTLTHRSLPGLSDKDLYAELMDSKANIEHITGSGSRAFSYPYSHIDGRSKNALRSAGYLCAFAVNGGPFHPGSDRWEIRRVNVTTNAQGLRFGAKLSGAEKLGLWAWWKARRIVGQTTPLEIRKGF